MGAKPNSSGLPWAELVRREMGFGDDKARYCMAMAEGAGRRVEVIRDVLAREIERPQDMAALVEAVHKLTDGQTATQLMLDFGIIKRPSGGHGTGPGRPAGSARPKDLDSLAKTLVWPAQHALGNLAMAARWEAAIFALPLSPDPSRGHSAALVPLLEELERWRDVVQAAIKNRKAVERGQPSAAPVDPLEN